MKKTQQQPQAGSDQQAEPDVVPVRADRGTESTDWTPMMDAGFLLSLLFVIVSSFSAPMSVEAEPPASESSGRGRSPDVVENSILMEIPENYSIVHNDESPNAIQIAGTVAMALGRTNTADLLVIRTRTSMTNIAPAATSTQPRRGQTSYESNPVRVNRFAFDGTSSQATI